MDLLPADLQRGVRLCCCAVACCTAGCQVAMLLLVLLLLPTAAPAATAAAGSNATQPAAETCAPPLFPCFRRHLQLPTSSKVFFAIACNRSCSHTCSCLVPVGPMAGQVFPPGTCLLSSATAGDRQTRIAYSFMQVSLMACVQALVFWVARVLLFGSAL